MWSEGALSQQPSCDEGLGSLPPNRGHWAQKKGVRASRLAPLRGWHRAECPGPLRAMESLPSSQWSWGAMGATLICSRKEPAPNPKGRGSQPRTQQFLSGAPGQSEETPVALEGLSMTPLTVVWRPGKVQAPGTSPSLREECCWGTPAVTSPKPMHWPSLSPGEEEEPSPAVPRGSDLKRTQDTHEEPGPARLPADYLLSLNLKAAPRGGNGC